MGGVTAGVGLFSGINTHDLIAQLLAVESRPRMLAQRRVVQLQSQQAAYMDLNSRISALRTAAAAFRTNNVFRSHAASSTNADVMTASASASAVPGSYSFIVDRLVTTQQMLSRGFTSSTTGLNAGTFSFEPAAARLDRDTSLSALNGGAGIERGRIVISDSTGASATIDLSRAATVNDVLTAIQDASGVDVSAAVEGGRFVIRSSSGADLTIRSASGSNTAESLGIHQPTPAGPVVSGSVVYQLGESTAVSALNDGNGIFLNPASGSARYDFRIAVTDSEGHITTVNVNIGAIFDEEENIVEPAPTTLGGIVDRINQRLLDRVGDDDIRVRIAADGVSLEIVDAQNRTLEVMEHPTARSTVASDLGLKTSGPQVGHVQGRRILAGLNTTLAHLLNGGQGLAGNGEISITARDGTQHTVNVDVSGSVNDIIAAFNDHASGKFRASLSSTGTGIVVEDLSGGTGNLIVQGDTAESLGIATDAAGIEASRTGGTNLQRQYITRGTLLSTLRNGQGIGTGTFRIIDSTGTTGEVRITSEDRTLDDVIHKINSRGTLIRARINSSGDGIELFEDTNEPGGLKIRVEDASGTVAANLNIRGESESNEPGENIISGSFERKITFEPGDSLDQIAQKINAAGLGVSASVINDGSGTAPFRLSLTSRHSGTAGRFIIDTGSFDLGLNQLEAGQDARIFYGSTDPARAVLLTSSTNSVDRVIPGVTIDLKSASSQPVTINVTRDVSAVEGAINTFIEAFNEVTTRINHQTRYNHETQERGPLLGEGTILAARSSLFSTVQARAMNVSSQYERLSDVGVTVGQGGKLQFNRDRFRAAFEQDPQGVADLFAARVLVPREPVQLGPGITSEDPDAPDEFSSLGVASMVERLADSFTNSISGTLTRRNQALTDQIEMQNRRIAQFDERLASRRAVLERQFLAMERAIGQLHTQQASLGQIALLG